MKPTWSKKFHFPGCQSGEEPIKFVPMPPSNPGANAWTSPGKILVSEPHDPLSFNSSAIEMIPVDKAVFGDEWIERDLVTRAQEIFGDSPERFKDRSAWVVAMTNMGKLVVKKHSHEGNTIFVVTPLALK
jgi:hypothetical protein